MIWLVLSFLFAAWDVSAEMYRYIDDQGALHFVESLNDMPKKHRRKATVAGEGGSVSYTEPGLPSQATKGKRKSTGEERTPFTGTLETDFRLKTQKGCSVKQSADVALMFGIEKPADNPQVIYHPINWIQTDQGAPCKAR